MTDNRSLMKHCLKMAIKHPQFRERWLRNWTALYNKRVEREYWNNRNNRGIIQEPQKKE